MCPFVVLGRTMPWQKGGTLNSFNPLKNDLNSFNPLKNDLPKRRSDYVRKPNCFHLALYEKRSCAEPAKQRPDRI